MAKRKVAVAAKPKPVQPGPTTQRPIPGRIMDIYLKTSLGVTMLLGKDAIEMKDKIENDKDRALDYRFFDDDKRVWAYWAVMDAGGAIKPPSFPDPNQYSLTSLQLYTKAVSYVHIFAHAIGLLKVKPQTLWDKMLKPTTIIVAIVGIVFVMMLGLVAMAG